LLTNPRDAPHRSAYQSDLEIWVTGRSRSLKVLPLTSTDVILLLQTNYGQNGAVSKIFAIEK